MITTPATHIEVIKHHRLAATLQEVTVHTRKEVWEAAVHTLDTTAITADSPVLQQWAHSMGEVQEAHSMHDVQEPMMSFNSVQDSVLLTTQNGSRQLLQTPNALCD